MTPVSEFTSVGIEFTSIGIFVVDDQHRVYFDCLRQLETAMTQGRGAEVVPRLLQEISNLMSFHFATEERLMESFGYPLRETHAIEHQKGWQEIARLKQCLDEQTVAVRTLEHMQAWLREHVQKWDAMLGEFLRARGGQ